MKKVVTALLVTAGALTISGGGVGIALVDGHPSFGKREFVSLEGGGLSKHLGDTITMNCVQDGQTVLHDAQVASGYGAYFQLGPTASWTGGPATCTSTLVAPGKKGPGKVLDSFSFVAGG